MDLSGAVRNGLLTLVNPSHFVVHSAVSHYHDSYVLVAYWWVLSAHLTIGCVMHMLIIWYHGEIL